MKFRISGSSPKILIQQPKVDFRNLHLTNSQVMCMQVICGPHLEEHYLAVAQSLSCVRLFATPWTAAHQASLSFTISQSLLKLISIESVMPPNHLILCCSLLLWPSIFPSIRSFPTVSSSHQVGKLLEFKLHHQSFQ